MVQRYNFEAEGDEHYFHRVESEYGEYITSDDYDYLKEELKDLQSKYDKLVMKLGDIYQEA